MPLLKRTPFSLADPPQDLEPNQLVYQIRFTKEIFTDYHEYLNRVNLYRQRLWTCKVTGKTNLTYEEALVSEKRATEKVQQFPKELVVPALRIIQYSMLPLKDLADAIATKLQGHIFVGAELYVKKDNIEYLCRILKVLEEGDAIRYKVARLNRNKKVVETLSMNKDELIVKKLAFNRNVFKSFIRESTYRSAPWVIHKELTNMHGISIELPHDLRDKVFLKNGLIECSKKRKKNEEDQDNDMEVKNEHGKRKHEKGGELATCLKEGDQLRKEPIIYPIDDLLVQPGIDDPVFTDRPIPLREFNVPTKCVGDLLMVWDFCSSFGRLLHLSPYSLEDFESAICQEKGNITILVETHAALLRMLIKDNSEYYLAVQKRNRISKITFVTWTEYLCDLLEMIKVPEIDSHISTIRRGHYGLLEAGAKLRIFRELINCAVESDIFRGKLDEVIEQRHALGATRRGEALEEARKKREKKGESKAEPIADEVMNSTIKQNGTENGSLGSENGKVIPVGQDDAMDQSESKKLDSAAKKTGGKHNLDFETPSENGKDSSRNQTVKHLKDDNKQGSEGKSTKQRKEHYEREMEKCFVRTSPLGKDRDYNRYWWFRRDGRIYVESPDSKNWGYYTSKEELDALMGSLNCKGERERALKTQLEKFYTRISCELQKRTKELTQKVAMEEAVVRRSTRVRAPPRENPAKAFLGYVNKWKED